MSKVRVDFFKPTGKWYTTEDVEWTNHGDIHTSFAKTLATHLKTDYGYRFDDMVAVCLNPAHEHQHPLMMMVDEIPKRLSIDDSSTKTDEHTTYITDYLDETI